MAVLIRNIDVGFQAVADQDPAGVRDAQLLDPSSYWDRVLAGLYLVNGDNERAAAEAERLVSSEPRNLAGWIVLERATVDTDPRRSAEAAAMVRRLDPFGAAGR